MNSIGARFAGWFAPEKRESILLDPLEGSPGEAQFRATQDRNVFFVCLDLTGEGRHHCTCVDRMATRPWQVFRKNGGMFCRHIVAAAFSLGNQGLLLPLLMK